MPDMPHALKPALTVALGSIGFVFFNDPDGDCECGGSMTYERCPTCGRPEAQFFRVRERGPRCNDPFHFPVADTDEQLLNFKAKGGAFAPVADERCPHGCHDGVIVQTTVYDEDLGEHRDTMIKTWCPLHGPVAEVTQAELREQDWGANDDLRQRLVADGGEGERLPAPFAEVIKQRDDTASELTRLRERVEAVQDGLRRLAQGGGSEVAKRMGIEMAADHLDAALNSDTQEENDG